MEDDCYTKKEKKHKACILCTLFLLGLLLLLITLYFALFKPRDPRIQVPTMQLAGFSTVQGASAASISLSLQVSMYNPNRADFIIQQGSTACLYYQDQQVGFASIAAGTIIPAQSFSTTSVSVSSSSPIPLAQSSGSGYSGSSSGYLMNDPASSSAGLLPLTTSVTISGEVTTASLFSHHSDVVSKCKLWLSFGSSRAYIQSYTCQSSYSLYD
ncbi:hypothetical protein KP509_38G042000 [Ceratopteris richardii]|uniref:Late embryogenesis abundant protein LEA-2 subgroup domain-containing protein n=1 Tax=Ceratopteris richardii TaxID=49495 RepID=A0A8T2Q461_CERRI|nr:hypothetical protein KP509_38G042000 [Ceratopteris richardii]